MNSTETRPSSRSNRRADRRVKKKKKNPRTYVICIEIDTAAAKEKFNTFVELSRTPLH